MEESELHSDQTLDDDDDWSETVEPHAAQRPKPSSSPTADSQSRQSPPPVELGRRQSAADDTADLELKDDDWTYPDDNSPGNGSPQQRERRDSGVGSSLTRASRSVCWENKPPFYCLISK